MRTGGAGGGVSSEEYTFAIPGVYQLTVPWPEPVDETHARSKFVKSRRVLQVRAPLQRQL